MSAEVQLQSTRALQLENEELKSLLGRASSTPKTLAAILKRPPLVPHDEFIVDIGRDGGIVLGQKVYAPGDVLIGHVVDVMGHTSKVKLLSSPGERYEVLVGEARTPTTAHGRGGGQYLAEVPSDIVVKDGDIIISPALGDAVFGLVTAVVSDPTQPFETILFAPPINIYDLRWILIDTKIPE